MRVGFDLFDKNRLDVDLFRDSQLDQKATYKSGNGWTSFDITDNEFGQQEKGLFQWSIVEDRIEEGKHLQQFML